VTSIGDNAFSGCIGFTKVINKSEHAYISLYYMNNLKKWYDEATGEEITYMYKGVAIREDYSEREKETGDTYTVTFITNGGTTVPSQSISKGKTVTKPADPVREGYDFMGWFLDSSCTTPYDFTKPVNADITLYAKWEPTGPTIEELTEIVSGMLKDDIAAEKIQIIGPSLKIADQEINIFEQEYKINISSMFGDKVEIPFEYNANDQSLKITVGTTVAKGEKTIVRKGGKPDPSRSFAMSYQQMKSFYRKLKFDKKAKMNDLYKKYAKFSSNLRKSKGSWGVDGDVSVFGYIDVKIAYDEKNKAWVPSKLNEGGVMMSFEGSGSYTAYPFAPPLSFVYLQAELDGEVDGTLRFVQDGTSFVNMDKGAMTADGEIGLSGAIGAGAEQIDLYAKGGVKGTLGAKTDIMPLAKLNGITASIGAFVEWCVFNIPPLTGSIKGTGFEWELYPERKMTKNILASTAAFHSPVKASSEQRMQLLGNSAGAIDASDSVYRFSDVNLTELGDDKLLLTYLDDSVTGADGKIKLMYRYYDGTNWSDGSVVSDKTYVDCYGTVSIVDGTPYIIYQGTESGINDTDDAGTVIGKLALYAARFNGTSFDEAVKIGETGKIRYSYLVCKLDGEPKAVWAQDAESSLESDHGDTTIYKCRLDNSAAPEIETTITGKSGRAVISGGSSGIKYVYYDGSTEVNVNGTEIDMSSYGDGVYSASFDGDRIYLLSGGRLYEYDGDIKDTGVNCGSLYRVVNGNAYYTVQEGYSSELYRKGLYSDTTAMRITDDGGFAGNFDVISGADTSHDKIAYAFQPVDEEKTNPYGLCTIKYTDNPVRYSASIKDIGYDVLDFAPGKSNKVYVTVENTGTEVLNNVMLTVNTKDGEIYNDKVVDSIEANEIKELILDMEFPDEYDGSEVNFSLTANEDLDKEANGAFCFEFSRVDLDITSSKNDEITVKEADSSPVNGVEVKLYDSFEDDSRLIRTVNVDTIAAGNSYSESITDEDWGKVTLDEASGFKDMVICVFTSEEENNLGNNSVVVSVDVNGKNEERKDDNKDADQNTGISENIISRTSSKNFTAGSDTYTVSWNSFVQFDGRKHNGVGTDASGNPASSKESGKKVSDLKVIITKNGEPVDPSKYTVKTKNNKNASVSIDGITVIQTNSKKLPSFTIKFKGKEYKDANKAAKNETFEFGIIPTELKQDLVTFDKVKTGKDGSVQIKQVTFKPEAGASGGPAPKPVKLKYKKQESKTDYVTSVNPDGSVMLIGKNNFFGSVVYKK